MDVAQTEQLPDELKQILGGDETAVMLPVKELHPFPNHPFKVILDDQMNALIESIKAVGVLTPILVRPRKRGVGYEIIAGHRRTEGAKRAGLKHIPAIVKDMSNELAVIAMVDTNMRQRESIRISEKAFAYRMKMESVMRMRKEEPDGEVTGRTKEIVARLFGVNAKEIQRITRLTNLIVPLLSLLDEGTLPVMVGYDLSFLSTEAQCWITEHHEKSGKFPSLKQAKELHSEFEAGTLTQDRLNEILTPIPKPGRQTIRAPSIHWGRILEMIPDNLKDDDIEDLLYRALEKYNHDLRYRD